MADDVSTLASKICNQIAAVFSSSSASNHPNPLDVLLTALATAAKTNRQLFVHGVGREFLMLKSLCMRLIHLGLAAYVVGDVTTPPIRPLDLLIVSAGPGYFSTVDAICRVAKANSATILILTAQPDQSPSCKELATHVAYLPARTMADGVDHSSGGSEVREVLPMGSLYEGAMFVLFEIVVYRLGEVLGETPAAIASRHTNLE